MVRKRTKAVIVGLYIAFAILVYGYPLASLIYGPKPALFETWNMFGRDPFEVCVVDIRQRRWDGIEAQLRGKDIGQLLMTSEFAKRTSFEVERQRISSLAEANEMVRALCSALGPTAVLRMKVICKEVNKWGKEVIEENVCNNVPSKS